MRCRPLCAAVLLTLVGCGFHLRGSGVETSVEAVYVRAAPRVDIGPQLARSLRQSHVNVLTEPDPKVVTIVLLEQQENRRTVTTTQEAQAAEYRQEFGVRYQIIGPDEVELVADRWARTSRITRLDRNNLVGYSQEQVLVRNEMALDLVQQILRSLAAATRTTPR